MTQAGRRDPDDPSPTASGPKEPAKSGQSNIFQPTRIQLIIGVAVVVVIIVVLAVVLTGSKKPSASTDGDNSPWWDADHGSRHHDDGSQRLDRQSRHGILGTRNAGL